MLKSRFLISQSIQSVSLSNVTYLGCATGTSETKRGGEGKP
jgi:hypothetical protein